MKFVQLLSFAAVSASLGYGLDLDVNSADSIRAGASTLAHGLMNYYQNNQSDTPTASIGTLPPPYYWWEAGAVWGGLIDYWAYTGDKSFNGVVTQAMLAQTGTGNDFLPEAYYSSMGNDDQSFWMFAALSALEYGYDDPPEGSASWLELVENGFNSMAPRWDTSSCNGGLRWQVFQANKGWDYKNSVSNGGFFQVAARLARYTGNSTYSDWAERIWDWTTGVGLIDESYRIYDGASVTTNCTSPDLVQWTYTPGIFLYGAAAMYNYTNASSTWETRTTGLLEQINQTFFSNMANATGVLIEGACEPYGTCNNDSYSFKAYLARFLGKTMIVAPYTRSLIQPLLATSAQAAAKSCSGPSDGVTCGQKWYTGGFDGKFGIGQELSALEVTQALLVDEAPGLQNAGMVKIEQATTTSTLSATVSIGSASISGLTASATPSSGKPSSGSSSSGSPSSGSSSPGKPSGTSTSPSSTNAAIRIGSLPTVRALIGGAVIGAAAFL